MNRLLTVLIWLAPLFVLLGQGCVVSECKGLDLIELQSGTYVTHHEARPEYNEGVVHANGAAKVLEIDTEAGTATLSYSNEAGEQVVERWNLVE